MMLKVGIIGLGNIGMDAHMKAYDKIKANGGAVVVEAVCDMVICDDVMYNGFGKKLGRLVL